MAGEEEGKRPGPHRIDVLEGLARVARLSGAGLEAIDAAQVGVRQHEVGRFIDTYYEGEPAPHQEDVPSLATSTSRLITSANNKPRRTKVGEAGEGQEEGEGYW